MRALRELSGDEFWAFVQRHYAVVVLFDAPWNATGRDLRSRLILAAASHAEVVAAAEVDVGKEHALARALRLATVPAIAYGRRGRVVEIVLGARQDPEERLEALLRA